MSPSDDSWLTDNIIYVGPSRIQALQDGDFFDALLHPVGLDTMAQQYFSIPVIPSWHLMTVIRRAAASDVLNSYEGIWHDILMVFAVTGRAKQTTHRFTVRIEGAGKQQKWQLEATILRDEQGFPFISLALVDNPPHALNIDHDIRFESGHIVMTAGAAALNTDFFPYLTCHLQGDWGELDAFDKRQNETAVTHHGRIHSAYDIATDVVTKTTAARIWIITEANRAVTNILTPDEY